VFVDVHECLCVFCVSLMLQRGTEAHCCRWHGRCVFCVCMCVCLYVCDVRECLCVFCVCH